jgi:hypothetical protein
MDTKLCRDCKFCEPERVDRLLYIFLLLPIVGWGVFLYEVFFREKYQFSKCRLSNEYDLVIGKATDHYMRFCSTERGWGNCGPDGKNFELKGEHVRSLSDKSLMDEVRKRGLLTLMKNYKKDSENV